MEIKKRIIKKGKNKINILILVVFTLTFLIVNLIYFIYTTKEIKIFDMELKVGDYVGINLEKGKLNFGTLPRNRYASATRPITMKNNYREPVFVEIYFQGELANFVETSENFFVMQPSEIKKITVTARVPTLIRRKNHVYRGKTILVFRKS